MSDKPRYEIIRLIRKSRTGGVYEAKDHHLERDVSMRRFCLDHISGFAEGYEERFYDITELFSKLDHPNIRQWLDAGIDEDGPYLISTTQVGNLLYDHITQKGALSEFEVYKMAQQMLEALEVAHKGDFIHGALTTRSVAYIQKTASAPLFQITDIGQGELINIFYDGQVGNKDLVDPTIMAPELFVKYRPTAQSDLFSIGHLCYLTLAGGHPFAHKPNADLYQLHKHEQLKPITDYANISDNFAEWIHSLIKADPKQRPKNASEALESLAYILVPTISYPPTPSQELLVKKLKHSTTDLGKKEKSYLYPAGTEITATRAVQVGLLNQAPSLVKKNITTDLTLYEHKSFSPPTRNVQAQIALLKKSHKKKNNSFAVGVVICVIIISIIISLLYF